MAKYYGSDCLTPSCAGHKQGAAYFRKGGRSLTYSSPSFNKGMRIAQNRAKNQGVKSRLSITKKSK